MSQTSLVMPSVCLLTGSLITGLSLGFSPSAHSQTAPPAQKAALVAVAKMMEAQRTYYQKNGRFQADVQALQRDFNLQLPPTFNAAVRTTTLAAYSYVIPQQPPFKAYVGAAFRDTTGQLVTIICENKSPGQVRPADPTFVMQDNPQQLRLECGDFAIEIPASQITK